MYLYSYMFRLLVATVIQVVRLVFSSLSISFLIFSWTKLASYDYWRLSFCTEIAPSNLKCYVLFCKHIKGKGHSQLTTLFWVNSQVTTLKVSLDIFLFGNRESYIGGSYLDGCGSHQSHSVHILGCEERTRLWFPGAFPVWCSYRAYRVCVYPGTCRRYAWTPMSYPSFCFLFDSDIAFPHGECRSSSPWERSPWWSMDSWRPSYSVGTLCTTPTI